MNEWECQYCGRLNGHERSCLGCGAPKTRACHVVEKPVFEMGRIEPVGYIKEPPPVYQPLVPTQIYVGDLPPFWSLSTSGVNYSSYGRYNSFGRVDAVDCGGTLTSGNISVY